MKTTETCPIEKFRTWFEEAKKKLPLANAMALATANNKAKPSVRMVLLKFFDRQGFVFYTNLESKKAQDLKANPHASLCFYWEPIKKQIRIEGFVERVTETEADQYFDSRPFLSRAGAWASRQSQPMPTKHSLWSNLSKTLVQYSFGLKKISRPDFWSGFRVIPQRMEFWQEGEARLHTRTCYQKTSHDKWDKTYLYP